jgi:DNA-binding CsgD family transcriptional regulator
MTKTQAKTDAANAAASPAEPRTTKTERLLSMLRARSGASTEEIGEALGWQPHTVRAALTGLRKKGHAIARGKEGSVTSYRIDA